MDTNGDQHACLVNHPVKAFRQSRARSYLRTANEFSRKLNWKRSLGGERANDRARRTSRPRKTNNCRVQPRRAPPAVYNFASAICRGDRCEPLDFVRPAPSRQKCATTAARISTRSTTMPSHANRIMYWVRPPCRMQDVWPKKFHRMRYSSSKMIRQQLIRLQQHKFGQSAFRQ